MTFTNNDQILQFNFIFEIYFDSQHSEKKHQLVSVERDRRFPLEFRTKNRLFLRPQLSLKSKTITNQQRIGCLVYPEITQISERSLLHRLSNKHYKGSCASYSGIRKKLMIIVFCIWFYDETFKQFHFTKNVSDNYQLKERLRTTTLQCKHEETERFKQKYHYDSLTSQLLQFRFYAQLFHGKLQAW